MKTRMWTFILITFGLLVQKSCGLCPQQCQCDNDKLTAVCSHGELEIVPIFLNPHIKQLEASHNLIRKLEGALTVYSKLETLDLSHNELHHLGKHQFVENSQLQQLNISNNFVSSIHPDTLQGMTSLLTLDVSKNILTSLENSSLEGLENLVDLRLSHNKLSIIGVLAFLGLGRLRELQLDHNMLTYVNSDWLIPLENLRFLYLSNNMLTQLSPFSFHPLKALKVLALDENRIHNVSTEAFRGPRSVDTLDMSNNLLPVVPSEAISLLGQLNQLDLSGNPIKVLTSSCFQTLTVLETLKLDSMYQLETIDGHAFVDNAQLNQLSLDNNRQLGPLPWGIFSANTQLHTLSVRNNSWETLAPQQVPHRSLRTLHISGNPFHCNCSLTWLWELYQRHNETGIFIDEAMCSSVSSSPDTDIPLDSVAPDELVCSNWTHVLIVISVSVLVTVALVCLAALVIYKYRHYKLNRHQYGATTSLHIKDDTMVYRGATMSLEPTKAGYSPTTAEPFYEVPQYCNFTTEDDPKSSISSKYSSSGYIGSELWEAEYLSSPAHQYSYNGPGQLPAQLARTGQQHSSPRNSCGIGSGGSSSSTASSNISKPMFFSPARNVNHQQTLMLNGSACSPEGQKYQTGTFNHPTMMMMMMQPAHSTSTVSTTTASPRFMHQHHVSPPTTARIKKTNVFV